MLSTSPRHIPSPHHRARSSARLGAALLASSAAALAGCSGASAGGTPPAPLSAAAKALRLAVAQSGQVSSLTARVTVRAAGSGSSSTLQLRMQLKPTTMIDEMSRVTDPHGHVIRLEEILTDSTIYYENPGFVRATGKSWTKLDLAGVAAKKGFAYAAVFQNIEDADPIDQARLIASSTDVRIVGATQVHGVATTEYAGTYTGAQAIAQLPAGLRRRFEPLLRELGKSPVRFAIWVDAQRLIRKAQETLTIAGRTTTTTFDVTSVNKPVSIRLPAPGQVASMPGA